LSFIAILQGSGSRWENRRPIRSMDAMGWAEVPPEKWLAMVVGEG
jgi:hypothetical protein